CQPSAVARPRRARGGEQLRGPFFFKRTVRSRLREVGGRSPGGRNPLRPAPPRPVEPRFVRCRCRGVSRRAGALTKTRARSVRPELRSRLRTVYQVASKTGISVTEALRWEDIKCLTGGPC